MFCGYFYSAYTSYNIWALGIFMVFIRLHYGVGL